MTSDRKSPLSLHRAADNLDFWFKAGRAVAWFAALAWMAWTQFLGPGIKDSFQNFVGITELSKRLSFVEQVMPAPRVVDWQEGSSRQVGACTAHRCLYALSGARTKYGEDCGRPTSTTAYLRDPRTGQNSQLSMPGFKSVELTREPTVFTIPLGIPSYALPGPYEFRIKVIYPNCAGRGEPIPRWTPWFPLEISQTQKKE